MRATTHQQHKALERKRTRRKLYRMVDALQGGAAWRQNVRVRVPLPVHYSIRAAYVEHKGRRMWQDAREAGKMALWQQRKKQEAVKALARKMAASPGFSGLRAKLGNMAMGVDYARSVAP